MDDFIDFDQINIIYRESEAYVQKVPLKEKKENVQPYIYIYIEEIMFVANSFAMVKHCVFNTLFLKASWKLIFNIFYEANNSHFFIK